MTGLTELRQYLAAIVRWWWLIILITGTAAAAGYYATQRQPRVYEATATVIVGQAIQSLTPDTAQIETSQQLALTYAAIARREPVLRATVEALGIEKPWRQLRNQIQVSLVPFTHLLEITAQGSSPEEARVLADEVARQLILFSPTLRQNRENEEVARYIDDRVDELQAKITEAQARVSELEQQLLSTDSPEELARLQIEIDTLEDKIIGWENNYASLLNVNEVENAVNYLTLIESAQAKSDPISPDVQTNTILAGLIGFLLALGNVFLLEYLDDTFRSKDDLARSLDLTLLGTIGKISGRDYREKLISSQNPSSPVTEAFRRIRSNIYFTSKNGSAKAVVVTSPATNEGKSTTVANLGLAMAQAGFRTIIVDADLRQPVQHQIFNLPNDKGLTNLLRRPDLNVEEYLERTHVDGLYVLCSGPEVRFPSELLGSKNIARVLASLSRLAEVIILDSPPVVSVTDTAVLSSQVDGVVLVVEAGRTKRHLVQEAVNSLQQARAQFLGVVLNRDSFYGKYN